jgi:hypothetical protein
MLGGRVTLPYPSRVEEETRVQVREGVKTSGYLSDEGSNVSLNVMREIQ